jgi:hypothetical protein
VIQSSETGTCGFDSLQALALALSYLRYQLKAFVSKGGRLVYPNDQEDEDVDIDAIFGARWDRAGDLNS